MNKILLLLALLLTVFINTAFGVSGEIIENTELNSANTQTIKELKNEVEGLKESEKDINTKLIELKSELRINNYFRKDINKEEEKAILKIFANYKIIEKQLSKNLIEKSKNLEETKNIKNQLLKGRKDLYKSLVPYVIKDKLKEYTVFVKQDVIILKEDKEIKEDIVKKNILLQNKVEIIKEKIKKNREDLNKKLLEIIEIKIDEKINLLQISEKFQKLSLKQKENVINNIIKKSNIKINELNNLEEITTVISRKIDIYKIVIAKLEKLLDEIKK